MNCNTDILNYSRNYDFDELIDRHGSNAVKTDTLSERYGNADLLPLWVADMDFATPAPIIEAMAERLNHPIFGYSIIPESYFEAIIRWLKQQQQWDVEHQWLSYIPGIVKGIGMVINVFSKVGDKIIIQPPVYHPFRIIPEENHRQIVNNPLKLVNNQYKMDFDNLESIIDHQCKILILSNPHNPGGVVWDKKTLKTLAEICYKNNILVISDEIHADLMLWGNKHTPFATVSELSKQNSITFGAPSKTFNIAGVVSSFAVVPNNTIRNRFYQWLRSNELDSPTIFSIIAAQTAYTHCHDWLRQLIEYLEKNISFLDDYLKKNIPHIKMIKPSASFLVWLDCRALGLPHDDLVNLFVKKAKLALNDGGMFGPGGEGFMRINIGTQRTILQQALTQLELALNA